MLVSALATASDAEPNHPAIEHDPEDIPVVLEPVVLEPVALEQVVLEPVVLEPVVLGVGQTMGLGVVPVPVMLEHGHMR